MKRLLVVEDEEHIANVLKFNLEAEGYAVDVEDNGEAALHRLTRESNDIDLILLDVMLPGLDGFETVERLRAAGSFVPVMMLTARGHTDDVLRGFELGADDYLPKPCNPREIVARIRAILRRVEMDKAGMQANSSRQIVVLEDVELNHNTRMVSKQGEALDLTSTEFNLLASLLEKAGQVLSKEELTETALGRKLALYDRSVDMHMSNLRRKLGPFLTDEPRIKTIRGVGYQYVIND